MKSDVESAGFDYVIYGHFGNSHIHLNILPKNSDEFEKAKALYQKMCISAIKSGGTFSAEHGVGKNKKALLSEMYGTDVINQMFRIKLNLDPNQILCRGNLFDNQ